MPAAKPYPYVYVNADGPRTPSERAKISRNRVQGRRWRRALCEATLMRATRKRIRWVGAGGMYPTTTVSAVVIVTLRCPCESAGLEGRRPLRLDRILRG